MCSLTSSSNKNAVTPIVERLRLVLAYLVVLPSLHAKVWSVNVVEASNHILVKCGVGSNMIKKCLLTWLLTELKILAVPTTNKTKCDFPDPKIETSVRFGN